MALLNGGGSEQLGEMELSLAFLGQTQGGKVERGEMNSNQSIDCHNYKMSTHLWLHRWRRRGRRVERSKIARQTPGFETLPSPRVQILNGITFGLLNHWPLVQVQVQLWRACICVGGLDKNRETRATTTNRHD